MARSRVRWAKSRTGPTSSSTGAAIRPSAIRGTSPSTPSRRRASSCPKGRKDRTMVLVDIRETPSAKAADIFLQIRPGKDFEVITTLRALVKGQPVDRERVAETGLTLEQLQDLVDRMKRAKFGVHLLRHGPVDDARQAHELRGDPDAGRGDERLHQVRGHADARPRQRHRRRRGHALDDGLSVRHQPVPRLSALQSGRVLDGRPAGPRRQRRGARPRRRSGRDDAAAGHRPPAAHSDHRARSQGDAHEPAGPRPHHDGGHGHQRARDRLPHGRDSRCRCGRR